MKALIRALRGGIALAWLMLAFTDLAYGHAAVVETSPADGVLLESAPDRVVIRFNEPVTPVSVQVLNAAGNEITPADPVSMEGDELRITLPDALDRGSYIASYRVISADSHPVAGSLVFSVGQVSQRMPEQLAASQDWGWRAAMVLVRAVLHAGILGGAGGVLFLLLAKPAGHAAEATARIAAGLAVVGCVAALLAIGIQGGLLIGGPASNLVSTAAWRLGLTSGLGTTAVAAFAGLALVAGCLNPDRPAALRPLAWIGAAAALASFALSGHIVSAGPRWITVPALLTHTGAVAFWAGSLLPLHRAVAWSGAKAAPVVERFSRVGVGAVLALVIAGVIISVLQVQSFSALVETTYRSFLLAKLALVAALLALAIVNKLRLTPRLAAGDPGAASALGRSIAAEIALVLGILVATAGLATTPPPRVLQGAAESHAWHLYGALQPRSAGLSVTIVGSGGSAEVVLESHRSGINSARIVLLDSNGRPLEAKEVTFMAANPAAGVEPIRRIAEAAGPGAWSVDHLLLVPSGSWTISIDALISDFEKTGFETVVTVR